MAHHWLELESLLAVHGTKTPPGIRIIIINMDGLLQRITIEISHNGIGCVMWQLIRWGVWKMTDSPTRLHSTDTETETEALLAAIQFVSHSVIQSVSQPPTAQQLPLTHKMDYRPKCQNNRHTSFSTKKNFQFSLPFFIFRKISMRSPDLNWNHFPHTRLLDCHSVAQINDGETRMVNSCDAFGWCVAWVISSNSERDEVVGDGKINLSIGDERVNNK